MARAATPSPSYETALPSTPKVGSRRPAIGWPNTGVGMVMAVETGGGQVGVGEGGGGGRRSGVGVDVDESLGMTKPAMGAGDCAPVGRPCVSGTSVGVGAMGANRVAVAAPAIACSVGRGRGAGAGATQLAAEAAMPRNSRHWIKVMRVRTTPPCEVSHATRQHSMRQSHRAADGFVDQSDREAVPVRFQCVEQARADQFRAEHETTGEG